jgi:predicted nucleic acid-binding protein
MTFAVWCPKPLTMSEALLDTSILIGLEAGRVDPTDVPDGAAISVVTLSELHLGVLAADDPDERSHRLNTLLGAERLFEPIPIDDAVARRFAQVVDALRRKNRRAPVLDALIAATAIEHGLVLYSHDADFEPVDTLHLRIIA